MQSLLLIVLILVNIKDAVAQIKFIPPATEKKPVIDTLHGSYITDNYRWLENKNDPKVIEWTKAQHNYGEQYLKATQKIHPGIKEEITDYMEKGHEGPLEKVGKRIFQTIQGKKDKQEQIYTIINEQKILIWDPVALDSTGNTATQYITYTYDGEMAAITVQKNGAEIPSLYLINTRLGKILQGPLEGTGGAQFTKDQQYIF